MLGHVLVRHVRHLLDVGASGKHPLAAVHDHRGDVISAAGLGTHLNHFALHLRVQRVHLGSVEADRSHAVADFESYELSHVQAFRSILLSSIEHRASTVSSHGAPDRAGTLLLSH